SVGKGGAGGYAPSPNTTSVSGGVTPRITSSPRTKTRGTLEPPWKVPGSRFFTAAASSLPRTTRGRPVATPRRTEADYAHAAASSPARLANGGATNGTTCPSLAVTSRTGLGRLGRLCWKGRRGEGAAPLPTSLFPWSCRTTAQPIGSEMWRVFLPLRLRFFTRVSERARAEGVGEVGSAVARMSGEAPPPCLYIKGWRGARRRHFALEWSSL
ncbi:hypothetical protein E2I00_006636, partial [Balaenoptera physalus]